MEIKLLDKSKKVIQLYIHSIAQGIHEAGQMEPVKEQAIKAHAGRLF